MPWLQNTTQWRSGARRYHWGRGQSLAETESERSVAAATSGGRPKNDGDSLHRRPSDSDTTFIT